MPIKDPEDPGAALRAAYPGPDCPPPERWLLAAEGSLDPAEAAVLDAHAASCPACAAERDLAAVFAAPPEDVEARREDVDFVVARLRERRGSGRRAAAPVVRFPRSAERRWRPLAAAAAVLVTVGLGGLAIRTLRDTGPALPPPPVSDLTRGDRVDGLAPAGEITEMPSELWWEPVAGAAGYRVTLTGVDDEPLWTAEVTAPPAELPPAVSGRLHTAVVYWWGVEALDGAGRRLAGSDRAQFRVSPPPETEPSPPGDR
jgi:hypothetical protein